MFKKLILLAITLFVVIIQAQTAYAWSPFNSACSSGGGTASSAICSQQTTITILGANGIIAKITNLVAFVAGAAAVIFILIGSFNMIASTGDSAKVAKARNTVFNSAIGLVIIIGGAFLIDFVVSKL